jgi:transposase
MGASIAITRTDGHVGEGLRELAARTNDACSARRMLAIALVLDGADRTSAARSCGMDRQTLRDWVHRYNSEGVGGLANRKAPGASCLLTPEQEATFAQWVEDGPVPEADGVVRWRRVDLRKKIAGAFGVEVHERTVGKFLAKLGYVRLSARPEHPRADAATQEAFKKTSPGRSPTASRKRRAQSLSRSGSRTKQGLGSRER